MKRLLIATTLFALHWNAEAQRIRLGQDRGGGHEWGLQFYTCSLEVLSEIKTDFPDLYKSIDGDRLSKIPMYVAIADGQLMAETPEYKQLSTARYDRDSHTVAVHFKRFLEIGDARLQKAICLHERLGIDGQEHTGSYPYSGDYLSKVGLSVNDLIPHVESVKATVSGGFEKRIPVSKCSRYEIRKITKDKAWGLVTRVEPAKCPNGKDWIPINPSGKLRFSSPDLKGMVASWVFSDLILNFSGSNLSISQVMDLSRDRGPIAAEFGKLSAEMAAQIYDLPIRIELGAHQIAPLFASFTNSCSLKILRDLDPDQAHGSISLVQDWYGYESRADVFNATLTFEADSPEVKFSTTDYREHSPDAGLIPILRGSTHRPYGGKITLRSNGEPLSMEVKMWKPNLVTAPYNYVLGYKMESWGSMLNCPKPEL